MITQHIEVVTASTIYDLNYVATTTREIKKHLTEFKGLMNNISLSAEDRVQSWNYVRAYTQILKDRAKQPNN
jgi:hypothetical protein